LLAGELLIIELQKLLLLLLLWENLAQSHLWQHI